MAHQKVVTKTTHIKTRVPKNGKSNNSGYKQSNMCHGTGVIKKSK